MHRLERALPWTLTALAVAFVALGVILDRLPSPWWSVAIVLATATAGAHAAIRKLVPPAFAFAMVLAGARLAAFRSDPSSGGVDELGWIASSADLAIGLAVVAMLWHTLRRRQGGLAARDWLDVLCVVLAASLIAWMLNASRLIEHHGVGAGLASVSAAYLPSSVLLLAFTIDLMLSGLRDNRSMRFIVAAATANVLGAVTAALRLAELAPGGVRALSIASLCAAALLMCAGFTHRHAPLIFARRHDERSADTPIRLAVLAVTLVAATSLLAVTSPESALDRAARFALSVSLACVVAIRLLVALRDHATAQAHLLRQVSLDELTGLPTRGRFLTVVQDALDATWRSERRPAIIQLNLDRFKHINDSYGHANANRVLRTVADRLDMVTAAFGGTVGRIGDDDFVVLDASTTGDNQVLERAAEIRAVLAEPIEIDDGAVFVTASIGVVSAPRHRTIGADDLMRRANIAADRAKQEGRNRVVLFDESMQANLTRRMDVEHALHGAIGRSEMRLYHQPIVDVATGHVSGFEALIRWQRDGEMVSPLDFIPIAEETGIVCELGAWALHEALAELREWIDVGIVDADATMSVNVSPRQIADPHFPEIVRGALERSRMPASALWLEMTETMMLQEPELAQVTLQAVREMGVRIALDDFGTGFSSLSLLQQFPIQRIKVDRAFVRNVAEDGNDQSLVRTIVALAKSMDIDLVAEGVETIHQLEVLRRMKCDKAQGFLISRPVPPDAMRSTMGALSELASLALFDPDREFEPATYEPLLVPRASILIGGSGLTTGLSRPIGQPLI